MRWLCTDGPVKNDPLSSPFTSTIKRPISPYSVPLSTLTLLGKKHAAAFEVLQVAALRKETYVECPSIPPWTTIPHLKNIQM